MNTTQGPVLDNNETPGCSSLTQRLENGTEIDSPKNYTWYGYVFPFQILSSRQSRLHYSYPFDWKTVRT